MTLRRNHHLCISEVCHDVIHPPQRFRFAPVFGGEASRIDVTKTWTREQAAEIEKDTDELGVIVFHDQHRTKETQIA